MDKIEQFIQDYTKRCSNVMYTEAKLGGELFYPWLTPDDAMAAAKIAREETIEAVCKHLSLWTGLDDVRIQRFKEDIYEELAR